MKVDSQTNALFAAISARQATRSAVATPRSGAVSIANPEPNDSASGVSELDFASMTPGEMQGVAKKLFEAGDIDLTELFMLQTMGVPLGKMGPQGEFVELSADEKEGFSSRPIDYFQGTKNAISYLEQTGQAANPKSGYGSWQDILAALHQRQGTPGLDVTV